MIGWNSAGGRPWSARSLAIAGSSTLSAGLSPSGQASTAPRKRGDAGAPLAGVPLDERPQPGREHQPRDHDLFDGCHDPAGVDGRQVAQHPQRVGHRDPITDRGRQVRPIGRAVDLDPDELGDALVAGDARGRPDRGWAARRPTGTPPTDGRRPPLDRSTARLPRSVCWRVRGEPHRRATPGCTISSRTDARARYHAARDTPASIAAARVISP